MSDKKRVVVWGTGNVGRPAIRAVAAHRDLELAGVIVHADDKVGVDAGTLAYVDELGVPATNDIALAAADDIDAVVYTVNADFRPMEALDDVEAVLRSGTSVVSPCFYAMYHPPSMDERLRARFDAACTEGNASIFASGVDPGWVMDILPLFLSGVSADVTEIRGQEIFNYALYDQPDAVRDLCGFGTPMDQTPPMLLDFSLKMVWEPMVRVMADGLGLELDDVTTMVEKRPLEKTVTVPGMGDFDQGTQGAFRFEVQGIVGGKPLLVIEHTTRIDDDCAPDWPQADNGTSAHQVQITGHPNLTVSVHGTEPGEPGEAGGGNATAANRIVNAIPAVCDMPPGIVHPLDLPPIRGQAQIRS